jgi:ABC-type oligopeptide transport system ATPase subunit
VETGSTEKILREPGADYTKELLAAVPEVPQGLAK